MAHDDLLERIQTEPPALGGAPKRGWYEALGLDLVAARETSPDTFATELAPAIAAQTWPNPLPLEGVPALDAWSSLAPELEFSLGLACDGDNDPIDALLASGALGRVAALGFAKGAVSDAGLARLAAAPALAAVRQLTFAHQTVGRDGVTALTRSPNLSGLIALQMLQTQVESSAVASFLAAHGPTLTFLKLEKIGLAGDDLADIFGAPWPLLESLQLPVNPLGDDGAGHLAAATLPVLTDLDLRACKIGNAGVAALAASPVLTKVEELGLGGNETPLTEGAVALAESPHLGALKRLRLNGCGIKNPGVKAIAGTAWPLESLELQHCYIFDPSPLAKASFAANLATLDLADNSGIDEHGVRALLDSPLAQRIKNDLVYEFEAEHGYSPV